MESVNSPFGIGEASLGNEFHGTGHV